MNRNDECLSPEEILEINKDISKAESKLKEIFKKRNILIRKKTEEAPVCQLLSLKCIELQQAFAHYEILVEEKHLSWEGSVHGGVIAFLIDSTIGAAIETLIDFEEERIATIHLGINYLSPIKLGECICAKAWFSRTESLNILRLRSGEKSFCILNVM